MYIYIHFSIVCNDKKQEINVSIYFSGLIKWIMDTVQQRQGSCTDAECAVICRVGGERKEQKRMSWKPTMCQVAKQK